MYVSLCAATLAQEPAAKPPDAVPPTKQTAAPRSEEKAALPFQIQLLETHIRFEANGDSRKEVHTIVKINNLAGARQFSRLGFDYNRAFQQVEIPLVKISHANGGTSEILPSAIADAPNPLVQEYPAYHDVRVKSVRILGLQDGDTIEYRVITTTTKHPLAPDFWLEHTFDRSGQVLEEHYDLELPAAREVQLYTSPSTPPSKKSQVLPGGSGHMLYEWVLSASASTPVGSKAELPEPDLVLTTYPTWEQFAVRLGERLLPTREMANEVVTKSKEIAGGTAPSDKWIEPLYNFVSQQIKTVDLPLGTTGFGTRPPAEILASGYATPEDKFVLFAAMVRNCCGVQSGLVPTAEPMPAGGLPRPGLFDHILTMVGQSQIGFWMDLNLEVAPFGMIPSQFRGNPALLVEPGNELWRKVPKEPPVSGFQRVTVDAVLSPQGLLTAKVKYTMRGDNELLLRVAFHQTPKERWKEVAGLLALSDGFRGAITNVTASDPMATKEPFTVEYEIAQAKFVDWSKKPVRIPALLPQIALPDLPGKTAGKIELGTPLDVQTSLKLQLPEGTTVQTPAATSVARDYATFASKYDGHLNTVTVSRHIDFLKREIPSERAADYNAFLRAVQNDQAQVIVLSRPEAGTKN